MATSQYAQMLKADYDRLNLDEDGLSQRYAHLAFGGEDNIGSVIYDHQL